MKNLCIKSVVLGIIGTLMFLFLIGAVDRPEIGKYMISGDGSSSKIFLLNTQTGEIKKVQIIGSVDSSDGQYRADF